MVSRQCIVTGVLCGLTCLWHLRPAANWSSVDAEVPHVEDDAHARRHSGSASNM